MYCYGSTTRFDSWYTSLHTLHQWPLSSTIAIQTGSICWRHYCIFLCRFKNVCFISAFWICSWFDHNWIVVNWSKTNAMLFSIYFSSIVPSNIDLRIKENNITFVDTFKRLGFTLDRELNSISKNNSDDLLFRHYCLFLNSLIKNGKAVYILSIITRLEGRDLQNTYSVPGFNLCTGKLCFSAPKLLNSFYIIY